MRAQKLKFPKWSLILIMLLPLSIDARTIFEDGFEAGRTCWPGSPYVGRLDLCFDVPYESSPPAGKGTTDVSIPMRKVDLLIAMDTTGSMVGEIANLKASALTILDEFSNRVADGAIGIVGYDDYPYDPYGTPELGDKAFYLLHRVMTLTSPQGRASIQNAIDAYATHGGGDAPESGWEMVFQVAIGVGSGTGAFAVPAFDPKTAPPAVIPDGEQTGEIGGVGIREGAVPILMWITDERNHNSSGADLYGPIPGVVPATSQQALGVMNQLGGRIIGVMSGENARLDLTNAAFKTNTVVPVEAWGAAARPAGCGAGQCCTGINGSGVTPVAGECPLVYEIAADGSGLGSSIMDGINHAVDLSQSDVSARLIDDPNDGIDAVAAFIDTLEANDVGPHPCTQGLTTIDTNTDGRPDTFIGVRSGSILCFDVVLKDNQTVPSSGSPKYYSAILEFIADGVTVLESRGVHFRVQP